MLPVQSDGFTGLQPVLQVSVNVTSDADLILDYDNELIEIEGLEKTGAVFKDSGYYNLVRFNRGIGHLRVFYDNSTGHLPEKLNIPATLSLSFFRQQKISFVIDFSSVSDCFNDLLLNTTEPLFNDNYLIQDHLSSGSQGSVFRALQKSTGHQVAVKYSQMPFRQDYKTEQSFQKSLSKAILTAEKEVKVLEAVQNIDNIVQLLEEPFISYEKYVLVMPLADQDLADYALRVHFTMNEFKDFAYSLLKAVAEMHSAGVVHHDLKPNNILMYGNSPVIADFGLAGLTNEFNSSSNQNAKYRAPEMFLKRTKLLSTNYELSTVSVGKEADVWSLACIFALVLNKHSIFRGNTDGQVLESILRVLGGPDLVENDEMYIVFGSNGGFDAVQFQAAFSNFELTAELTDLFRKMFKWNPQQRISAQEALVHPFFQ